MALFNVDRFSLHSGGYSPFLIDCRYLTEAEWDNIAQLVSLLLPFDNARVVGIPKGGLQFQCALQKQFLLPSKNLIIVDDVFTTSKSMEEYKEKMRVPNAIGLVLFARAKTPDWITPIFTLHERFRSAPQTALRPTFEDPLLARMREEALNSLPVRQKANERDHV